MKPYSAVNAGICVSAGHKRLRSLCRTVTFDDLPNQLLLKIFSEIEAISCWRWARADTSTGSEAYETVRDDTLKALINGYQKRYCLPLVCKRWSKLLTQPSYLWAGLHIDFHELWNIQQVHGIHYITSLQLISFKSYACLRLLQRFIHQQLLFKWISLRTLSMRHLQLDFDSWCQRYYQGTLSSVQAGSSVGILLQMLDGSLQQVKMQDAVCCQPTVPGQPVSFTAFTTFATVWYVLRGLCL